MSINCVNYVITTFDRIRSTSFGRLLGKLSYHNDVCVCEQAASQIRGQCHRDNGRQTVPGF